MTNTAVSGRSVRRHAIGLTLDQILSIHSLVAGETPQWSPDGHKIAFVSSLGGSDDVWTVSPEGGFPTRLTLGMGEVSFLAPRILRWSPDGQYLSYISRNTGNDEVCLWPENGDSGFTLTSLGGQILSMSWSPDSRTLAISCNRYGNYDIYNIEVATGATTRLTRETLNEVNPVFTPDGKYILYVRLNESWEDHDIVMIPAIGGESTVILNDTDFFDYSLGAAFGYPMISSDGDAFFFRSQRSGYINYWKGSLKTTNVEPLSPQEVDQTDAAWSHDGNLVAYITNRNGTLTLEVVDSMGGSPTTVFSPSVGVCSSPQWSPDDSQISFLYGTPTTPDDLWLVSLEGGEAKQLTFSVPGGNLTDRLTMPEKVSYRSFDGLTINAYLYAPPGNSTSDSYPGIMFIHGGPTAQFIDDLQPQVQYLVQRGYVVLLPNIRGSSGYGRIFETLNDKDWGHGDLKDAIAGAEFLKGRDYVNSAKMGITGTSYGAYLSMCAIGFTQNIFQAAVPMSGYGDRPKLRAELELRHIKQMEHEFGTYEEHKDVWYKCSPIYGVKDATTPAFVLNGEGREPESDGSKDFAEALKQHYKTVDYKAYPNETYYVQSREGVREMLQDVAEFFDRYLKDEQVDKS